MNTPRLGIAIDLDQLRGLMAEFLNDLKSHGHVTTYGDDDDLADWRFETFLQWLKKRQHQQPADDNLLTFRIEKEGAGNVSSRTNRT